MILSSSLLVIAFYFISAHGFCFNSPIAPQQFVSKKLQFHRHYPLMTSHLSSFISSEDKWSLWAVVASAAALGIRLESNVVGKSLSGPVCAMLITATLTNIGILPSSGSVHISSLLSLVVKIATPLLLLGSDLKKILSETGILLKAFLLGTLGTSLGSILAFSIFGCHLHMGDDGWRIAGALTAKNIGGGLNFMQVASALAVSPASIGTALAVDNILGLIYFPFISYLGRNCSAENPQSIELQKSTINEQNNRQTQTAPLADVSAESDETGKYDLSSTTPALALGLIITAVSELLERKFGVVSATSATILTVLLATIFSQQIAPLVPAGNLLGRLLLMLFFGGIGNSSGTVSAILQSPSTVNLFGFGLVLYIVHIAVILVGGKVFDIPLPDILVASNANIGNAATASALAASKGWSNRVVPAFLVGTLGNAVGSIIGLGLSNRVFRTICGGLACGP